MRPEPLERILSSEDPLEPSSGFAGNVMEAVRRQAAEPPPLPFPWLRFVVGLAACMILAAAGAALLLRAEGAVRAAVAALAGAGPELGYAALALVASMGLARLPRALARR